jgi:hypothetical protein
MRGLSIPSPFPRFLKLDRIHRGRSDVRSLEVRTFDSKSRDLLAANGPHDDGDDVDGDDGDIDDVDDDISGEGRQVYRVALSSPPWQVVLSVNPPPTSTAIADVSSLSFSFLSLSSMPLKANQWQAQAANQLWSASAYY